METIPSLLKCNKVQNEVKIVKKRALFGVNSGETFWIIADIYWKYSEQFHIFSTKLTRGYLIQRKNTNF